MKIKRLVLGFFSVNCYILEIEKNDCIIIDPGAEYNEIKNYLDSNNLNPLFILNTHGHYDHIGAVNELMGYYNIKFYIHESEENIIRNPEYNLSRDFGKNLSIKDYSLIRENNFKEGSNLGISIKKMPGHTPGSIVIKYKDFLFTGDLLFKGAIGRTDLPGGSAKEIKKSLLNLTKMNKNLLIYPGHGELTNLGEELKNNYFLNKNFLSS